MKKTELLEWIEKHAEFGFSRSGGPGGQYVNTADTKVTLKLPLADIPLPEKQKTRVFTALQNRINSAGLIVIQASETRSQSLNRERAVERACRLISSALIPAKKRHTTHPSRSSKEKRIRNKKYRGELKRLRHNPSGY